MTAILLAHAAFTLCMTGLIWFVQVVHYPLFARADRTAFADFAREHAARTSFVVAPLMLGEAATAIALVLAPPAHAPAGLPWLGILLLAGVWLSTAALQVPCHRRLARGFDASVVQRLLRTNWLRTTGWSLRAIVALWLLPGATR